MAAKRITIEEVEKNIESLEIWLSVGGRMPMKQWSRMISEYNAMLIKRSQMRGEEIIVTHYKSEYII